MPFILFAVTGHVLVVWAAAAGWVRSGRAACELFAACRERILWLSRTAAAGLNVVWELRCAPCAAWKLREW